MNLRPSVSRTARPRPPARCHARAAEVHTLAGTGRYEFGARNGAFADARFQHPLGIAWHEGRLLVAGSYNGALRVMGLEAMRVSALDEGSFVCTDPLCLPAAEPAGVTVDGPGGHGFATATLSAPCRSSTIGRPRRRRLLGTETARPEA